MPATTILSLKSRLTRSLALASYFILAMGVAIAVGTSIWLASTAAYQNVKFVRSTEQLLSLIGLVRSDATADNTFGQKTGEDLVDDLVRRAQIPGPVINGWDKNVRAQIQPTSFMRIETDIPMPICRRLAYFFGKNADGLKLQKIEAHDENGAWRFIYNAATPGLAYQTINAACGDGTFSTLALTLPLR